MFGDSPKVAIFSNASFPVQSTNLIISQTRSVRERLDKLLTTLLDFCEKFMKAKTRQFSMRERERENERKHNTIIEKQGKHTIMKNPGILI